MRVRIKNSSFIGAYNNSYLKIIQTKKMLLRIS
ncbi:hypothetical protein SAMN05421740_104136 [Parapedobacter koreensis]|uniref:Uncharacterized protein n=1 Tax=Parapedobacter koreensis TaxID=332977 RepID=A0A1H7NXG8_9SPHI|nr:hypothetical protein SAMN05421740_104136 [Parapedobacter koreensis]